MDKSPSRNVLGGALWINLANTVRMREHQVTDMLEEPGYLDEWLRDNELHGLSNTGGAAFSAPPEDLLPELLRLRGVCRLVLEDVDHDGTLSEEAFAAIRAEASRLDVALRAERDAQGLPHLITYGQTAVQDVLYPIVRSMFETLASVSLDRIRICEHDDCILHFVDTSKSGKRRWCSMETCGNRHKAAEFYAKKKQQRGN
ncbi:putative RNA-binding Zn ribbon-like protein [Paenibacillus rhizosphaerae]|uniref:Putative RNA-binding Zn ribbon-like protein n=1 Tax=Paenibacillus rhizosphaerae TaxID=297318 RepID=A0A839TWY0_9BACL|nr:CGNR zinc finger domain-containing protein [Paenibacillus rhizosphaerae]MBB3130100.1 putative RNA-binding Zn ribbon-like protein [Paenibacillus rhizosphaerae]